MLTPRLLRVIQERWPRTVLNIVLALPIYVALWWWKPPVGCDLLGYLSDTCPIKGAPAVVGSLYVVAALCIAFLPIYGAHTIWVKRNK